MSEQTKLDIVQKTSFEKLADKIEASKKLRELNIKVLEQILRAHSYVTCVMSSDPRPLTTDETTTINNFIDTLPKNGSCCVSLDTNGYLWDDGNTSKLLEDSNYWRYWYYSKCSQNLGDDLSTKKFHENLWNYSSGALEYNKLPEFVRKYPWVFPPNVAELHKEMVALQNL